MSPPERRCPGCGLTAPVNEAAVYDGYYNTSPECWSILTEVIGAEFSDAILFGQVHQLTVDTYAVQHPGGPHPDKSIDIHLAGLYLVLELGFKPPNVPRLLQRLAGAVAEWPHFPPPDDLGPVTVEDVLRSETSEGHAETVRRWADTVWQAWSDHHTDVARFTSEYLRLD